MRVIELDANGWRDRDDLYASLLPALEAPEWHGRNLDALYDSVFSGFNGVKRPFELHLIGTASLPPDVREHLRKVIEVLEFLDVTVICNPPP